MLGVYLEEMKALFGFEGRGEEEKKKLEEEMVKRLLRETTRFLEVNLDKQTGGQFLGELDKASGKEDAGGELRTLTKYLMKVSDVKYKLDQWMRAVLADVSYEAVQQ